MLAYHEEIDGLVFPKLLLLPVPNIINDEVVHYKLEGLLERFYEDNFYQDLLFVTVPIAALTIHSRVKKEFGIDIPQLINDMHNLNMYSDAIYQADYFVVRIEDLEELLSLDTWE